MSSVSPALPSQTKVVAVSHRSDVVVASTQSLITELRASANFSIHSASNGFGAHRAAKREAGVSRFTSSDSAPPQAVIRVSENGRHGAHLGVRGIDLGQDFGQIKSAIAAIKTQFLTTP